MSYFESLDTAASGLTAQRIRMDVIAQNIASASTTRNEKGLPYRRKVVVFEERLKKNKPFSRYLTENKRKKPFEGSDGVRVTRIIEDSSPFKRIYDPNHPDADEDGYVEMPNVDIVTEMINMISASRAYEANITSLNTTKSMALKALELGE